ncbi:MAG TPA: metallophosphoesterase family protein [Candidatus Eisenbacteria bacterium]|nr:metallophosphoesterase family protein [Candidatus Eisenbacteria bacterium]
MDLAYDEAVACYVIGDIHGCVDELVCLIDAVRPAPSDRLIFLGDYVDRGPDSKGVISYILGLKDAFGVRPVFLKGNHEDMFLAYLGLPGRYGDMFLYNGGGATLASYGVKRAPEHGAALLAELPPEHIKFLRSLVNYHVTGGFLCVHAGVNPLKPLEEQDETETLWIRNEFIANRHRLPYTVIFGHTPQREVFYDLPYKIGIDTGLVYGNKLTCIDLEEKTIFQITRRSRKVNRSAIKHKWSPPVPAQAP